MVCKVTNRFTPAFRFTWLSFFLSISNIIKAELKNLQKSAKVDDILQEHHLIFSGNDHFLYLSKKNIGM